MRKIQITDSIREDVGISYVFASMKELIKDFGGEISVTKSESRIKLTLDCPEQYYDLYKSELEDKIADVIAVKYKYHFSLLVTNFAILSPLF